jgi:hypothetical protein
MQVARQVLIRQRLHGVHGAVDVTKRAIETTEGVTQQRMEMLINDCFLLPWEHGFRQIPRDFHVQHRVCQLPVYLS